VKAPARRWEETGEQYAERLRRDYVPALNALDAPFRPQRSEQAPTPQAAGVPSANRGLKSPTGPQAPAANDPALAIVDFLTFTAQLGVLLAGEFGARVRAEAAKGCETSIELLCRTVLEAIAPDSGLRIDGQVRGFRNFYDHHCRILSPAGKVVGFVALGGERQRGSFCMELTGEGCAHVTAWAHTRCVLEGWAAKLTRVDCAHDDREGRVTLDDVKRWHAEGAFTTRGRPPAIGFAGYADGSGQTVYIGKNTGNQQLCAYEKGKQLGDPDSFWVRLEARFGAKYREIPYEILERPWEFIVGHYPPLSWICELSTRMETAVAKAAAHMAASLRHARRQCGRVVNAIASVFSAPADFAEAVTLLLKREGLPAWVDGNPLGAQALVPVLEPQLRALCI
jgi:phage replication initiation protein